MSASSAIDLAVVDVLRADATLAAMLPDGVYLNLADPGSQRYALVTLSSEDDGAAFGRRNLEDGVYIVQAVILKSTGGNAGAAADRIDVLLENVPLVVAGYLWRATYREHRINYEERDDRDPLIVFKHHGGEYRVQMTPV